LGDGANLFQADKSPECRLKAKLFFQVYVVSIPLLGKPFAGILDIRDLNLPKESLESNHRAWGWKMHPSLEGSFCLMRSEVSLGWCFRKRVQGAGGLHHRSEGTGNCPPDLLGGVFDVLVLISVFFAPIFASIPQWATGCALVAVGLFFHTGHF
jgi:hypothetical protein